MYMTPTVTSWSKASPRAAVEEHRLTAGRETARASERSLMSASGAPSKTGDREVHALVELLRERLAAPRPVSSSMNLRDVLVAVEDA